MEWQRQGCQVAGPHLNRGSVRSEGFVARWTRPANGIFMTDGSQGYSSEQSVKLGLASVHTTTTGAPVVGPSHTCDELHTVGRATDGGVPGDGNGGRPAGHGHGVVFRPIVNPCSGLLTSLVIPPSIGREPRSRSFRPSIVPLTTHERSVSIRSRCSRSRGRIPSRVDSPPVHRSSENDYRA